MWLFADSVALGEPNFGKLSRGSLQSLSPGFSLQACTWNVAISNDKRNFIAGNIGPLVIGLVQAMASFASEASSPLLINLTMGLAQTPCIPGIPRILTTSFAGQDRYMPLLNVNCWVTVRLLLCAAWFSCP